MSNRRGSIVIIAIAAALLIAGLAVTPVAARPMAAGKPHFMIITQHTPEQCARSLEDLEAHAPKLLAKMEWGCRSGDHTGWALVQADSEEAARNMLPAAERAEAKIVPVDTFTAQEVKAMHAAK